MNWKPFQLHINQLSGTNDRYKPINKIKVRLEPGGKLTPEMNLTMDITSFDDVTPGNYKLFFDSKK